MSHSGMAFRSSNRASGCLVKCATPDKDDWADFTWVLSGIAKGEHCIPRVPHNCQWGTSTEAGSKLVQISDVASHRQGNISAASLPWLDRAEEFGNTLRYRCHVANGGRTAIPVGARLAGDTRSIVVARKARSYSGRTANRRLPPVSLLDICANKRPLLMRADVHCLYHEETPTVSSKIYPTQARETLLAAIAKFSIGR